MAKYSLQRTCAAVRKLAFKQIDQLKETIEQLHTILEITEHHANHEHIELILEWLKIAHTLRPADFKGISKYICDLLNAGKQLPPQLIAALTNYTCLPPKSVQRHIIGTEHRVQRGNYDRYITRFARAKFKALQRALNKNAELKEVMADFRARHPEFCAAKKVRRRWLAMERNFHPPEWYFTGTDEHLALLEFDSICYRFNLFGMEDFCQTPLLQKISVNATAHGIIIFIPRYWSFDYKRDLNWKEINKLLKSWGMPRQGESLSNVRLESDKQARAAYRAYEAAGKKGLKGPEREQYAITKGKLHPNTNQRRLFRLLKRGKRLCAPKPA